MMSSIQDMSALALELLNRVAAKAEIPNQAMPASLGYPLLDASSMDFKPADLILITTKTAEAKASMMINTVLRNGKNPELPRLFFSGWANLNDLTACFASAVGRIDQAALRTGVLTDSEWPRLTEAVEQLRHLPVHIFNGGAIPLVKLKSVASSLSKKVGRLSLIVVDACCLQDWGNGKSTSNLFLDTGGLRFFLDLAKRHRCAVVVVSASTPYSGGKTDSGCTDEDNADVIEPTISMQVFRSPGLK